MNIYNLMAEKVTKAGLSDGITIDERRLTFAEWWNKRVRGKPDPRIHIKPIKVVMFDFSDPDEWKVVRRETPS